MKPSHRNPLLRNFILAASISLCLGQAANAAARTWTGSDGIWETGVQGGWDAVWAAADTGTFNGTGGTVTLQSAISAGVPLSFSAGNYTLQSNDATERIITLGALGVISQGSGVTTTIGSMATIANANQWAVDGVSKAGNTFNIENGGKLSNTTSILTIRETTLNIKTGGIINNNNSTIVGDTTDGAILNVQGGTLTIPTTGGANLILGNGAVTSSVTIGITTGGAITFTDAGNTGGIRFGPAAQAAGTALTGTFDLDGGIVTANKVYEGTAGAGTVNSTFNFNGGTLKALKTNTTDFMTGLNAANVKSGGANIDSAAFNILIAQSLLDGGGGGGLTKTGTGALTLSGTNAYTGTTAINEGTLTITTTGALPGWDTNGRYAVANGATLAVYNAVTDGNIATMLGTTNFAAGASLGFDTTTASRAYSVIIGNTAQGTLGLTKLGANTLTLNQANTYTGTTTLLSVSNNELLIQNAGSLGTTAAGTTVLSNARLVLDGGITVTGETANLSGNGGNFFGALQSKTGVNKWTGNITISANDTRIGAQAGSSMEVSGVIDSGISTHLVTFRPADTTATVIVSGANTYVGPTTLVGGLVTVSSINSVVGGTASSNLGAPTAGNGTIKFGAAESSGMRYIGSGEITDRAIDLAGTTHGGRIDQSGTGLLKFTSAFTATGNGVKTLTLQGSTAGTGEIAGAIVNSTSATSLAKAGTGTWTLSGTNTYTGTTAVNAGTLKLDYGTGNDTNKLSDTTALTLGGGTLDLVGGSHTETVVSTTLTAGTVSKLTRTGGSAVLQMNTITRGTGASIDFSAPGIASTDNANANGILGTWATINGTDWAANSTGLADGSITAATYTDLDNDDAIANGSTTNVRINSNGGGGNMTLGSATTTINTLLHSNASQAAIINMGATNTLLTNAIMVGSAAKGLTIGASIDDGFLTTATAGGDLLLRNNSATELLTINSVIANNTSASTLTKVGVGTVVLAGTNTYTGNTNLAEGTLKAGSSGGFSGTSALVMTGSSTLDLGGFDGAFTNLTATAANTITTTGAGSGVDTLTISALSAGSGALFTDNGTRQLALSVAGNSGSPLTNLANTFSGGLIIDSTVRITVTNGTVGSPGAITSGPFGRGAITVNGGNVFNAGAQIWFGASNRTLVNDVIVNGNGGMGSRGGTFRIGTNATALTGLVISGNIDANLADATFGGDSTADGTALLLSGKLTGNSGFRFFLSANTSKWTATLNNATVNPNDYAGDTTVSNTPVTLALGAANQIPNGSGKGNLVLTAGTLDLAGFSETINGLSGAGTVDNVSTGTSNTLTLGDGDATGTSFSGVIKDTNGTLSLVKTGTGTQTLSGINDYSGNTTVNDGTLILGNGTDNTNLADAADVIVASGATLNLNYSGTDTIDELTINGVQKAIGVWGAVGSGAQFEDSQITSAGTLTVTNGPSANDYSTWANGYSPAVGAKTADDDGDGLTNFAEYAFGLNPKSGSSANPISQLLDKNTGLFKYTRRNTTAFSTGVTYTYEYSTTLSGAWTPFTPASTATNNGNPTEEITIGVPAGLLTNPKLFIHVKAND